MSTILSGLDSTNRLVEAVGAGALVQDVAAPATIVPIGASADAQSDGTDANASGSAQASGDSPSLLAGLSGDGLLNGIDIANLGDVTGGSTGALPNVAGLETTVQPVLDALPLAGDSTGGLTHILDTSHLGDIIGGTDGSILTLAGSGATAQPVFDPANAAVLNLHAQIETLVDLFGLQDVGHAVTELGETAGLGFIGTGGHNLITDTVNLPANVLDGNLGGSLQNIGSDLTDTVNATGHLVNAVLHGNDVLNPVPELLSSLGSNVQNLPLLTVNGGNNAGDGGLLGGVVGDIAHSNSGHLVDADVGPQQSGGIPINVLSSGDSNTHTASVNAVDVGPSGPHLLDLGVLTGPGVTAPLGGESPLPLPAVADMAGATHGILDLHGAHII